MHERFHLLTAKVLAGEASSGEKTELEELLVASSDLRAEFDELHVINKTLTDFAPLTSALDSAAAPIPPERYGEFEKAYQQKFGRPLQASLPDRHSRGSPFDLLSWLKTHYARLLLASGAIALLVLVSGSWSLSRKTRFRDQWSSVDPVAYLLPNQGEITVRSKGRDQLVQSPMALKPGDELNLLRTSRATIISPNGSISLTGPRQIRAEDLSGLAPSPWSSTNRRSNLIVALFGSATNLSNTSLLLATRASAGIPLYSPLGATVFLKPIFLWKVDPNKTYDLHITDELNPKSPPWDVSAVRPPLRFDQVPAWQTRLLIPNNLYRLTITESGSTGTASTYTFRTTQQTSEIHPLTDETKLLDALDILSGTSGRTGDAFADLMTLNEPLSSSELALRLKLLAFGEAGYREEFNSIRSSLVPGK